MARNRARGERPESASAPAPPPASSPSPRGRRLALTIVLYAAGVDAAFLLATAVAAIVAPGSGAFTALGAVSLFGWVYLVYLGLNGARRRWWDWRFPALIAVTGGAIGALVGGLRMRRQDVAEAAAASASRPSARREGRKPDARGGAAKTSRPPAKRTAGPRGSASRRRPRGR